MKMKVTDIHNFALSWWCAIITIVVFNIQNSISFDEIPIAVIDAAFKSITLVVVMKCVEETNTERAYSGASFLLLVAILYNQNSINKYAVNSLYTGAIDKNGSRFLASMYINIIIVVTTIIWRHIHKKNRSDFRKEFPSYKVPRIFTWIFVFIYSGLQFYSIVVNGIVARNAYSRTMTTVINSLMYVTYTFVLLSVEKNKKQKYSIASILPLITLAFVNLLITLLTGGKQFFLIFMLIVACGFIYLGKLQFRMFRILICISPVVLQLITSLSEIVSGRVSKLPTEFVLRYHVFRYDLSDLAFTISSRFDNINHPFSVILEAFLNAVPRFIYSNKPTKLTVYPSHMKQVGLDGTFDFNDTFFSMGAEVMGFFGMFLIFFSVVIFYEWLSKKIINIKRIGVPLFFTFIGYFAYVESDWSMFIYNTRDLLVYLVIGWIIFMFSTQIVWKIDINNITPKNIKME